MSSVIFGLGLKVPATCSSFSLKCCQFSSAQPEGLKKLMEYLSTGTLLNCSGTQVEAAKAFKNRKIIAYYFSASWCGPCKQLLPKIKNIYKENKSRKSGLEIIYVSSDTERDIMLKYFQERHGGWYAVPFEDTGGEILRQIYNITFIPQIVVTKDDGTIISREGTKDVEKLGIDVLKAWDPSSI